MKTPKILAPMDKACRFYDGHFSILCDQQIEKKIIFLLFHFQGTFNKIQTSNLK